MITIGGIETWLYEKLRHRQPQESENKMFDFETITFPLAGDAPKPKKLASGLIGFRSPFDFTLAPKQTKTVDLQMTCSVSLLTMAGGVIEQGKNIVVTVVNDTQEPLQIAYGDVIARAYPLVTPDYEIGE